MTFRNKRQRGQTLIIAMIVLGLLLILGFVFLGIVDRNVQGANTAQTRTGANDLADAGIRYAQSQLATSSLGADWRGTPTTITPTAASANFTKDPDIDYLRPGSGRVGWAADNQNQVDLGGPDGLGPFVRVNFSTGRALVRVRYAPSDANAFDQTPTGPLRTPGVVHNYLIIESIGREGVVNLSDPTTLAAGNGVQFQGFTSAAQLVQAKGAISTFDSHYVNSRRLIAFATPGIIDYARFETNKYHENRAADIGFPAPLGVDYLGQDVGLIPPTTNGVQLAAATYGTTTPVSSPATNPMGLGFGSIRANCDLTFHGNTVVNLNTQMGDKILVDGNISSDAPSGSYQGGLLTINAASYNPSTNSYTFAAPATFNSTQLSSRSPSFSTDSGLLIDGVQGTDAAGVSRGVGRMEPPSIETIDPQTLESRYVNMTRNSGVVINGVNSGEFGHGQGVYVSNAGDTQIPVDEAGRAAAGAEESLVNDWLNPNNGGSKSGWVGPYYIPPGAYLKLLPTGFTIQLDSPLPWMNPNGSNSGAYTVTYRIGMVNGQEYIVDSLEDPNATDGATSSINFAAGQPFNGVLYFEGNVRVLGTIPTDVQLTVVSGATIYIEGSIVRGVIGNDLTSSPQYSALHAGFGDPLTRPSRSMLMLMAKDYVTVNTTMFLGPSPSNSPAAVEDQERGSTYNAVSLQNSANGSIDLNFQFVNDPLSATTAGDPSTTVPYAMEYRDEASGAPLPASLLISHTMADGNGQMAVYQMQANAALVGILTNYNPYFSFPGSGSPFGLAFPGTANTNIQLDNGVSTYLGNTTGESIPMYGLGGDPWQRYDKFETRAFRLVVPTASSYSGASEAITGTKGGTDPFIAYDLYSQGLTNDLRLTQGGSVNGLTTNDTYIARTAIVPGDVRIEASMFAEEGSFFIIPGPWFNPNSNDTRRAVRRRVRRNRWSTTG